MTTSLKRRKVLITGASAGIGWACAKVFYTLGDELILVSRRSEKIKELALAQKWDMGRVHVSQMDIQDRKSIDTFVSTHLHLIKDLDILVNNAGLALGLEPFQESSALEITQMIETNVTGLIEITRQILPHLIARRSGLVIQLGSIAGMQAYGKGAVYCATKAAVHRFTEALRYDCGGTGVRFTVVAPGKVAETEFSVVRLRGDEKQARAGYDGYRPLKPEDVAESIRWVASLPEHFCVPEIVLMPTDQPSATSLMPLKS